MGNEILKKATAIFVKIKDKNAFVNKFKDSYSVEVLCKVLDLNRSTYYKDLKHKPTKTQINNDELDSKILKVYYDSKRRYGAPEIFKVLRNELECSESGFFHNFN